MKIHRRRPPHPEISLVSTADVAFLLLIFFLSTAAFAVERGIVLDLPGPRDRPAPVAQGRVASLAVGDDRGFVLDGERVGREALRSRLAARYRSKPDLIVRIAVSDAAPYASLIEALDQVKLSGVRSVTILPPEGS